MMHTYLNRCKSLGTGQREQDNGDLASKSLCCGCASCAQRCPKHAIKMEEDVEGFLYPKIDATACIDCGLCEKVCPFNSDFNERKPLRIFAAQNKNEEERLTSSSGGIFAILSHYIFSLGGVVFGAQFSADFMKVEHNEAHNDDELQHLLRSKYIQSSIGETFKRAKIYLEKGIPVLFSGTPCQIKALYVFLRKKYINLWTVDVVCHGVPSPGVWRHYWIEEKRNLSVRSTVDGKNTVSSFPLKSMPVITGINFREKHYNDYGWKKFGFVVRGKSSSKDDKNSVLLSVINIENPFIRGFVNNLYIRESCYHCPARSFKSQSDFTIGDLWGVGKLGLSSIDDDTGLSLLCANTEKGVDTITKLIQYLNVWELSYKDAIISNGNLVSCPIKSEKLVSKFHKYYQFKENLSFGTIIEKSLHKNFFERKLIALQYKLHLK